VTSNRFFIQKDKLQKSPVLLTGEEHHHLHSVVRIRSGDQILLFDESGTEYLARIEYTVRDRTQLFVMERMEKEEPRVKVTLAQSLIKTNRLEFLLQKSTELGVYKFLPVISSRIIVRVEGRIEKKLDRWRRIVREAVKQSGNTNVPTILPPKPLEEVLKETEDGVKIFLNEQGGTYLKEILLSEPPSRKRTNSLSSSIRVLIGPEGGWTEQEEQDILDHGFKAVSLGPQTLRAETAAISCLVLINHFWNL
jgi:16S rRNA (uracil1498-N3)-methyltransferase